MNQGPSNAVTADQAGRPPRPPRTPAPSTPAPAVMPRPIGPISHHTPLPNRGRDGARRVETVRAVDLDRDGPPGRELVGAEVRIGAKHSLDATAPAWLRDPSNLTRDTDRYHG